MWNSNPDLDAELVDRTEEEGRREGTDPELTNLFTRPARARQWARKVFGLDRAHENRPGDSGLVRWLLSAAIISAKHLLFLSGLTAITWGVWQWWMPAGWIVGGVFLVLVSFVLDRL